MNIAMPNPSTWQFWAGVLLLVWYFAGDYLPSVAGTLFSGASSLLGRLKNMGTGSTTKIDAATAVPTYAAASEALSLLARYKAQAKGDPEYAMVMASLKTVEAAA